MLTASHEGNKKRGLVRPRRCHISPRSTSSRRCSLPPDLHAGGVDEFDSFL